MSMPTVPLSIPLLVVILLLSAIPGLCFPPRVGEPNARSVRLPAALVFGSLAGWLLGSSVLASGLSVPTTVLVLVAATVVFAEGLAGRGWPWAGAFSATVYLAAVALDFIDRTGERIPWTLWLVLLGIAIVTALIAQFAWRMLRPSQLSGRSESDNSH